VPGAPDFALHDESVDERTHVVEPEGEVDLLTAPKLGRRLIRVADQGKTSVVVDLTRVTFIDSTGISVLINALRQITSRKGRLALVCPTKHILRPFEIAGLVGLLDIFRTREEALGCVMAAG
jgi:anti-sigma B factor antagonist